MLWVKAFHVFFVVSWFAGLLYLPRLFVYHSLTTDEASKSRFCTMEKKLFVIMSIGAAGTVTLGGWLLHAYAWAAYSTQGWLHFKLGLIAVLLGYHVYCYRVVVAFLPRSTASPTHLFSLDERDPSADLVGRAHIDDRKAVLTGVQMNRKVDCPVLKREAEGLTEPPHPGELGQRIYENVSAEGWEQWLQRLQTIINENQLNTGDVDTIRLIEKHMLGFLFEEGEFGDLPDGFRAPGAKK